MPQSEGWWETLLPMIIGFSFAVPVIMVLVALYVEWCGYTYVPQPSINP